MRSVVPDPGVHRELSDAVSRARMTRVAALEVKLLRSRKGAETTASIFALRNADPSEWRDVRSVQHDHNVTIATLTDEQLFAIASGRASEIQVIEHEPAPGLGTGLERTLSFLTRLLALEQRACFGGSKS